MRLPNLLATRRGRLVAFFALYVTEGIPLGFGATAVAFQLRKMGVGPAEIGAFVGSFYLPWAFKWAFGPLVDVFRSQRLGHRRAWILGTQLMMAATLALLVVADLPGQLGLFTAILLVHNTFAAIQDVAIDALACNSLQPDERGLANGLMFAGAAIGTAIGGAGVLQLMPYTGLQPTFFVVAAAILVVTALVVLPMREPQTDTPPGRTGLRAAAGEMRDFAVASFRSFLATRGALAGVAFALLPAGAMTLGLSLRATLSAEFGLGESEAGRLELWSNVISAAGMVLGGWLSDRFGRRRTLFVYLALMSLPVAWLGWRLETLGYGMPRAPGAEALAVSPLLGAALWAASMVYSFFLGLMYGTRSAIIMDVTDPRVAATQFTAYMAMMNLAIAYSATWQGLSAEALGYPRTLYLDACIGLLCLLVLPLIRPGGSDEPAGGAARRARGVSAVLSLACLAWLPFQLHGTVLGAARPIVDLFFTLVFVASAVVLLAAAALQARSAFTRLAPWLALGLLAMYARKLVGTEPLGLWVFGTVALAGAAGLARLAVHRWDELA